MSEETKQIEDGGPAMPFDLIKHEPDGTHHVTEQYSGMSLRDHFAAKAMQGMMAQGGKGGWGEMCANNLNGHNVATAMTISQFAYRIADAMLAERKQVKP